MFPFLLGRIYAFPALVRDVKTENSLCRVKLFSVGGVSAFGVTRSERLKTTKKQVCFLRVSEKCVFCREYGSFPMQLCRDCIVKVPLLYP